MRRELPPPQSQDPLNQWHTDTGTGSSCSDGFGRGGGQPGTDFGADLVVRWGSAVNSRGRSETGMGSIWCAHLGPIWGPSGGQSGAVVDIARARAVVAVVIVRASLLKAPCGSMLRPRALRGLRPSIRPRCSLGDLDPGAGAEGACRRRRARARAQHRRRRRRPRRRRR